jgi:hypothetical protein
MRYEKIYNGFKTVLEGSELDRLLEFFQVYETEEVKRRFETDDPLVVIQMTAYKAFADMYPDFDTTTKNINGLISPDSRKAKLLYAVTMYLTVKCIMPDIDWNIFFDVEPVIGKKDEKLFRPGTNFHKLSRQITVEVLLRSANMKLPGPADVDSFLGPSRN